MDKITVTTGATSGGMAYYKNLKLGTDFDLPLSESPVRFSIFRKNGLSSNAWRIWIDKHGNAYIMARDHMQELKVSLHRSGKQHIAFTSESGLEMTEGNRFWDQWWEPPHYRGPQGVSTFNLLFPSWALTLNQAMRDTNRRVWNNNQVAIEAAETPMATVISFVITDDDLPMRFSPSGEAPNMPLAVLPLGPGKRLWVGACYAQEGNMQQLAGQAMLGMAQSSPSIHEKLSEFPDGHVFGMCASGHDPDKGAYLMLFAVKLHGSEPAGLIST